MDKFNKLTSININIDLLTKTNLDIADVVVVSIMNAYKNDDNVCTLSMANIMLLTHLTAYKLRKSIDRLFKVKFIKNVIKNFQIEGYRVCLDEYLSRDMNKK
jgi:hypothetical protein